MITEEEFQAALDANPDDHVTRLLFADWLDEQEDERATGYRALGLLRRWPMIGVNIRQAWFREQPNFNRERSEFDLDTTSHRDLPRDWFQLVALESVGPLKPIIDSKKDCSRRNVENEVALAFARLPAERQAELLAIGH